MEISSSSINSLEPFIDKTHPTNLTPQETTDKRIHSIQQERIKPADTETSPVLDPETVQTQDSRPLPVADKVNQSVSHILSTTKEYSEIVGLIYSLIGKSVYIEGKFYNRTSLTKRVLTILTNESIADQFKRSSAVSKLISFYMNKHGINHFTEYLTKQVDKIQEGKLVVKISKSPTEIEVLRTLDHIDPSKIAQLEWSDTKELEKYLRPGDIIFFQNKQLFTKRTSTRLIMRGQLLAKLWLEGKTEPFARTYTHVAIYIGNGKIAEAVPGEHGNDVRILPLSDRHFKLNPGDERQYKICRPLDKKMAKKAARLASQYAEDKGEILDRLEIIKKKKLFEKDPLSIIPQLQAQCKTKAQYSRLKAAASLFGNANFSENVKKRVLHQILESSRQIPNPKNGKNEQQDSETFFCSHFVGECLQRGNALQLLPEIKRLIKDRKIDEMPDINGPNGLKLARKWVKDTLKKCPDIWDNLKLKYDSEYLSPQKFRSIVSSNPDLFRDIYTIVPPLK